MTSKSNRERRCYIHCLAAVLVAAGCVHGLQYWLYGRGEGPVRPLAISLSEFPSELGNWRAVATGLDEAVEKVLLVEDAWSATYVDGRGVSLSLFIGYYADESIGKLHQPTVCYPGSGWTLMRREKVRLLADGAAGIPANLILFKRGASRQAVLYWYHLPHGVIAEPAASKLHRMARLLRGDASRSIIKIQAAISVTGSVEDAVSRAEPFLRLVERALARHLGPGWVAPAAVEKKI